MHPDLQHLSYLQNMFASWKQSLRCWIQTKIARIAAELFPLGPHPYSSFGRDFSFATIVGILSHPSAVQISEFPIFNLWNINIGVHTSIISISGGRVTFV